MNECSFCFGIYIVGKTSYGHQSKCTEQFRKNGQKNIFWEGLSRNHSIKAMKIGRFFLGGSVAKNGHRVVTKGNQSLRELRKFSK